MLPYIVIFLFLTYLYVRHLWMMFLHEKWMEACDKYLTLNPLADKNVVNEYKEIWPRITIASRFWEWNFKKYIIHQDGYETVINFILNYYRERMNINKN